MEQLLNLIKTEWSVISTAPFTFILLCMLIYGTIFAWHRSRIIGLKELVSIRDQRIKEYERITKASSPDEAAAKYAKLEQGLENILSQWRKLNNDKSTRHIFIAPDLIDYSNEEQLQAAGELKNHSIPQISKMVGHYGNLREAIRAVFESK